jgi:thiosulfate/3-mercaptopyruvate sulfurtransferase
MVTMYRDIITANDLAEHLDDPDWILFDCRFDLANPAWGETEYAQSHIPGAIYAHLDRDLSGPVTTRTGRHPLPDQTAFVDRLSAWGVDKNKQVVVYDQAGGTFAVRLWWLLKYYGHEAVAVLDGGYARWIEESREVNTWVKKHAAAVFIPDIHEHMLVSAGDVEGFVENPGIKLVDSRAPARFNAETEPIDTFAGHIPGALNRYTNDNLKPDGTLLPPETLRKQFSELLGDTPPENAVVYCGSGVTSCHHVLAMAVAGMPLPRLYAGSWSEWIRDPKRPTVPPP